MVGLEAICWLLDQTVPEDRALEFLGTWVYEFIYISPNKGKFSLSVKNRYTSLLESLKIDLLG